MTSQGRLVRRFQSLQRPQSDIPEVPVDKTIKPSQVYCFTPPLDSSPGEVAPPRQVRTPLLAPVRVRVSMLYSNRLSCDSTSETGSEYGTLKREMRGAYSDRTIERLGKKQVSSQDIRSHIGEENIRAREQLRKAPSLRQVAGETRIMPKFSRKDTAASLSERTIQPRGSQSRTKDSVSQGPSGQVRNPAFLFDESRFRSNKGYENTIRLLHHRLFPDKAA